MNQREITLFLACYLHNTAAANDAQRIVLLSFITKIRAQILMLKLLQLYIILLMDGDLKTTALSCTDTETLSQKGKFDQTPDFITRHA